MLYDSRGGSKAYFRSSEKPLTFCQYRTLINNKALRLHLPLLVTFGGGVIGNTAGSGPVVGGSSPPPRASGGARQRAPSRHAVATIGRRFGGSGPRVGRVGDSPGPVRLEA